MKNANRQLRAGIIGAGLMGRWHANAIERARARVTAVADLDLAAARRLAARYREAQSYANLEKMLGQALLDVLHVCTPPETHAQIAEQAIQSGVHLLIEKPITDGAEETERLYELASARKALICPVHQFPFQDGALRAMEWLPRIGRLIHIQATFCSAGASGMSEAEADAIAADILPHPLSLMQLMARKDITEARWRTSRPGGGELRVTGEFDDVTSSIFVSMNIRPTVCSMQLFGAEGTIHLDLFHGFAVIDPGRVSRWRKIARPFDLSARTLAGAAANLGRRAMRGQPAYPGLQRLVNRFISAIQRRTAPPISPAEAIAVARVRDQILRA